MAIRVTIPGIIRIVCFRTREEVRTVNDSSIVQRSLSGRGGPFQRAAAAKLAVFRTTNGDIWPPFRDRLDPLRAKSQRDLEAALSDIPGLLTRLAPEIGALATYVHSGRSHRPPEVIVQQMVGRLFFSDYAASEESYDAAHALQIWLSPWPIKPYSLKLSGGLQRALDQISELARGNTSCAHATALAMENIVKSVELMRRLARKGDNLEEISPEDAVARTLRAPKRVIRETRDGGCAGNIRLHARSLVIFGVEAARRKSRDVDFAFFADEWNYCPAHAIVLELLASIWQTAQTIQRDRACCKEH
jgi:hypothetical protein